MYNKRTVAGCLNAKIGLNDAVALGKNNVFLINKNIGCFKLPPTSKQMWRDILNNNKTISNSAYMNHNFAWIV
jgi:hypothetical protein